MCLHSETLRVTKSPQGLQFYISFPTVPASLWALISRPRALSNHIQGALAATDPAGVDLHVSFPRVFPSRKAPWAIHIMSLKDKEIYNFINGKMVSINAYNSSVKICVNLCLIILKAFALLHFIYPIQFQ